MPSAGRCRPAALILLGALACSTAAGEGGPADLLALRVERGDAPAATLGGVLGEAPAIVSFWATYCVPCRAEVPVLNRAARRWRARGVRVVGVAIDVNDASNARRAAREWGIDYETFWTDKDQSDSTRRLLPQGLPSTFFTTPKATHRVDHLLTDESLDRLAVAHLGIDPSWK
jgi:thiol-disulfide isomerase/thioredoxin